MSPNDLATSIDRLAAATDALKQAQYSHTAVLVAFPDVLSAWGNQWLEDLGKRLEGTGGGGGGSGGGGGGGGGGGPTPPEEEEKPEKSKLRQWAEDRLINTGRNLASKAASPAGAEAAGLAGRGAAAGAEAGVGALGAAAAPIAILLACAVALKAFHDTVVQAAKAQQAHNFQYANNSASMAAVQVQTEIADAFRDRMIGDKTSGSAAVLADANTRYDDTAAKFEILWSNIKNLGISAALNLITTILEPIGAVAENVDEWIGTQKPDASDDMAQWMDETRRKTEAQFNAGQQWFKRKF